MFDIGFWEFALIGVITLIVVGPERLPAIARKAGHYIGKIKRFITKIQTDISQEFETVQTDISQELETDKLKEHLSLEDKDGNIVEILKETKSSLNAIKQDADKS